MYKQASFTGLTYPWVTLQIVICLFFTLFTILLFYAHFAQTVLRNLTTNEQMNRRRYPHFIDPMTGGQLSTHPFDRGPSGESSNDRLPQLE